MNNLSLTVNVVLNSAGEVDVEASHDAFGEALANFKNELELTSSTIAEKVHAIFDRSNKEPIQMPALVSLTVHALGCTAENFAVYKEMEAKVTNYIRANSDQGEKRDKETKKVLSLAEPERTRTFAIKRGIGGGVIRWSDHPVGSK
jgi:hypothetical protein